MCFWPKSSLRLILGAQRSLLDHQNSKNKLATASFLSPLCWKHPIFVNFVQFKFQYMLNAEGWTIEQYDWNTEILYAHFPFFRSSESEVWTHLLWCVCIVNILAADTNITHQEIHPHWLILAFSKVQTSLCGGKFFGIYQTSANMLNV